MWYQASNVELPLQSTHPSSLSHLSGLYIQLSCCCSCVGHTQWSSEALLPLCLRIAFKDAQGNQAMMELQRGLPHAKYVLSPLSCVPYLGHGLLLSPDERKPKTSEASQTSAVTERERQCSSREQVSPGLLRPSQCIP